jgi:hypothetical protein
MRGRLNLRLDLMPKPLFGRNPRSDAEGIGKRRLMDEWAAYCMCESR